MAVIKMCKNETCVQMVPPSLNSGVERLYCSWKCQNAQNQRNYRRRRSNENGDGVIRLAGTVPFLRRAIALNSKSAEKRFKKHLQSCVLNDHGKCPARLDPYDKQRLCLVKAVLREDWDQLRRAEQGRVWVRELTTIDGMWIADSLKQAQRVNIMAREDLEALDDDAEDAPPAPANADPVEEPEMPAFPALPDRTL